MIRQAQLKDIPQILELLLQINILHKNHRPDIFNGPTTKYTEEELKELVNNKEFIINVYEDGIVLGYTISKIRYYDSNTLKKRCIYWIDDFCIDEKYRHQGIGKKLFEYSKKQAEEYHCDSIELNVWSFNRDAVEFYEHLGMTNRSQIMELKIKD